MRRKDNFILQNVGGENLLVPLGAHVIDMNGLVILNATGHCVWELLAEDRSVDDLTAAVVERFDVDPRCARADVQIFLDELARLRLLEQ